MIDKKFLKAIGIVVRDSIRNRIRQDKVVPKTIKHNKAGKTGTTLIESHHLVNSIKYQIRNNEIIIGTNRIYAQIQHEGGTINKTVTVREHKRNISQAFGKRLKEAVRANIQEHSRKMNITLPARPYMFIDQATKQRISKIVKIALKEKIKSS